MERVGHSCVGRVLLRVGSPRGVGRPAWVGRVQPRLHARLPAGRRRVTPSIPSRARTRISVAMLWCRMPSARSAISTHASPQSLPRVMAGAERRRQERGCCARPVHKQPSQQRRLRRTRFKRAASPAVRLLEVWHGQRACQRLLRQLLLRLQAGSAGGGGSGGGGGCQWRRVIGRLISTLECCRSGVLGLWLGLAAATVLVLRAGAHGEQVKPARPQAICTSSAAAGLRERTITSPESTAFGPSCHRPTWRGGASSPFKAAAIAPIPAPDARPLAAHSSARGAGSERVAARNFAAAGAGRPLNLGPMANVQALVAGDAAAFEQLCAMLMSSQNEQRAPVSPRGRADGPHTPLAMTGGRAANACDRRLGRRRRRSCRRGAAAAAVCPGCSRRLCALAGLPALGRSYG